MTAVVVAALVGLAHMEAVYGSAWVVQKVDKAGQSWIWSIVATAAMYTAEIVLVQWAKLSP
jgi:hypothetical protein